MSDNMGDFMPWAFTGGAGVIGRAMFHAKQVQAGRRKPVSWALLWDLPISLATGWMALGLCKYLGIGYDPTISVAIFFGYLGPYGVDTMFAKASEKILPTGAKERKDG